MMEQTGAGSLPSKTFVARSAAYGDASAAGAQSGNNNDTANINGQATATPHRYAAFQNGDSFQLVHLNGLPPAGPRTCVMDLQVRIWSHHV